MITTVSLEDVYFKAYHGFYEAERKMGNDFYLDVNIDIETPENYDDDIDKTINYEEVYNICRSEMNKTCLLIETVAQKIIKEIRKKWPFVLKASVKIKKLGPQLGGKVKYSTIEIKF